MKYIVKLCSKEHVINEETFHVDNQAFIYVGRVITNSLFPIEIQVERKYVVEGGVEILTAIVYHLYKAE